MRDLCHGFVRHNFMRSYKIYVKMFSLKFYNATKLSQTCIRRLSTAETYTNINLKNGIKTITMCHPKSRNSLSIPMMETLFDNVTKDQDNPDMRVIIITGTGPIFSAGHNLKELSANHGHDQHQKVFSLASHLMNAIIDSPVPVIARVDGLAAAAGCQLVAQCDMVICSENSSFSTPGANFGIFCSTPGIALGRAVPKNIALHMLLTGLAISSHEAQAAGLVNKVCSPELLDVELNKICSAIMNKSRSVVEQGKKFFYTQMQVDIRTAYSLGEKAMVNCVGSEDGQEGITSFIEKRKPKWNN